MELKVISPRVKTKYYSFKKTNKDINEVYTEVLVRKFTSHVCRYIDEKMKESLQIKYVDKPEETYLKQHLNIPHLEEGDGIKVNNSERNVNNDISIIYNCKDSTKIENKNNLIGQKYIDNIKIELSSLTAIRDFIIEVTTEIFNPTSLFGNMSRDSPGLGGTLLVGL